MKKDSIIKMLKTLKSKATDVNISIIWVTVYNRGIVEGIKKQALIDSLLKKEFPKRRILDALQSLNKKGITMETRLKGTVRVNLTSLAWAELLKAEAGKKVGELLSESEKILKDVATFAKNEGDILTKKALKKIFKGFDYLKDEFKKASKK